MNTDRIVVMRTRTAIIEISASLRMVERDLVKVLIENVRVTVEEAG